jgi:hypothetical protein
MKGGPQAIAPTNKKEKPMKTRLLSSVFALALTALVGAYPTAIFAQPGERLWSVAVHIEYPNGSVYDHVFASGIPTSELPSILEECGRSHRGGSFLQYHCYPIPE